MTLPLDIWHAIITDHLSDERGALCSLATVSSLLANPALDALWRNMQSLRPIVTVINSFAPLQSSGEFLVENGYYDDEDWIGENWTLCKPLSDSARIRAQEYLARIRFLEVTVPSGGQSEPSLWLLLTVCVGSNGPILPNLTGLAIAWNHDAPFNMCILIPLLSPSVESIHFYCQEASQCREGILLCNLFMASGYNLKSIAWAAPLEKNLFSTLKSFTSLRTLNVYHNQPIAERTNVVSLTDFLAPLTSLCYLTLNLEAFPLPAHPLPTPILHHSIMEYLNLEGTPEDYQWFFGVFESVSVHKFEATISNPASISWYLFCKQLYSSLPYIQTLELWTSSQNAPRLLCHDLAPLLNMPMKHFTLHVPNILTADDLRTLILPWPKLIKLVISSGTQLEAGVLASLSQLVCLEHLNLRLDFQPLLVSLAEGNKTNASESKPKESCCSLTELIINRRSCVTNPADLDLFSRHLLDLFPRLWSIQWTRCGSCVLELQSRVRDLIKQSR